MIGVIIPTRYAPPTLQPLLDVLAGDGVHVVIKHSNEYGHELHVMWNTGCDELKALGCEYIAVLNDDITILPGTLGIMAAALASRPGAAVVFPQRTPGAPRLPSTVAFSVEPIADVGHCFMFRASEWGDVLPRFDEGYHLWHGDLIFFAAVRALPREIIMVRKLVIDHLTHFSVDKVRYTQPVFEDMLRNSQSLPDFMAQDWTGRRVSQRQYKKVEQKLARLKRQMASKDGTLTS